MPDKHLAAVPPTHIHIDATRQRAGTATELSRYPRPECTTTFGLGGVRRLDDDYLLVSWATSGVVTELDAAGQVVLEVFGPFGMAVGYSASINDLPGALP